MIRLSFLFCVVLLAACPVESPISRLAAQPLPKIAAVASRPSIPDFVSLVKREGVTVVNISATRVVRGSNEPGSGDQIDELFRRFLERGPREHAAQSVGSGFIVSEDGHILTNAHLVADMEEVTVKLLDKREFKARVVGLDRRTDVALIKIDAKGLRKVTLGDPSALEVGEWVAAIGSPFGFENSVTAGIVSAKGRLVPDEAFIPFIQTDVAVNPGNSGGPLFNARGEVVGINSMIYSDSGVYMGLSFAVPIDLAVQVANELRTRGKVVRGRLGVRTQEVTPQLARAFGLADAAGALVLSVERRSPAETAGIVAGDIIVMVDGKSVGRPNDLLRMTGATAPGTTVRLQVWRRGAAQQVVATISELGIEQPRVSSQAEPARANRFDLALSELTPGERHALGTEGGLFVRGARGAAAKAGVQAGDVILAINDTRVERLEEFDKALAALTPGVTVALLVMRGSAVAYIPIELTG